MLSKQLESKYRLKNANEFVLSIFKSLILNHPQLAKYLNKKDEDITLLDLNKIMVYLEADKKLIRLPIEKNM